MDQDKASGQTNKSQKNQPFKSSAQQFNPGQKKNPSIIHNDPMIQGKSVKTNKTIDLTSQGDTDFRDNQIPPKPQVQVIASQTSLQEIEFPPDSSLSSKAQQSTRNQPQQMQIQPKVNEHDINPVPGSSNDPSKMDLAPKVSKENAPCALGTSTEVMSLQPQIMHLPAMTEQVPCGVLNKVTEDKEECGLPLPGGKKCIILASKDKMLLHRKYCNKTSENLNVQFAQEDTIKQQKNKYRNEGKQLNEQLNRESSSKNETTDHTGQQLNSQESDTGAKKIAAQTDKNIMEMIIQYEKSPELNKVSANDKQGQQEPSIEGGRASKPDDNQILELQKAGFTTDISSFEVPKTPPPSKDDLQDDDTSQMQDYVNNYLHKKSNQSKNSEDSKSPTLLQGPSGLGQQSYEQSQIDPSKIDLAPKVSKENAPGGQPAEPTSHDSHAPQVSALIHPSGQNEPAGQLPQAQLDFVPNQADMQLSMTVDYHHQNMHTGQILLSISNQTPGPDGTIPVPEYDNGHLTTHLRNNEDYIPDALRPGVALGQGDVGQVLGGVLRLGTRGCIGCERTTGDHITGCFAEKILRIQPVTQCQNVAVQTDVSLLGVKNYDEGVADLFKTIQDMMASKVTVNNGNLVIDGTPKIAADQQYPQQEPRDAQSAHNKVSINNGLASSANGQTSSMQLSKKGLLQEELNQSSTDQNQHQDHEQSSNQQASALAIPESDQRSVHRERDSQMYSDGHNEQIGSEAGAPVNGQDIQLHDQSHLLLQDHQGHDQSHVHREDEGDDQNRMHVDNGVGDYPGSSVPQNQLIPTVHQEGVIEKVRHGDSSRPTVNPKTTEQSLVNAEKDDEVMDAQNGSGAGALLQPQVDPMNGHDTSHHNKVVLQQQEHQADVTSANSHHGRSQRDSKDSQNALQVVAAHNNLLDNTQTETQMTQENAAPGSQVLQLETQQSQSQNFPNGEIKVETSIFSFAHVPPQQTDSIAASNNVPNIQNVQTVVQIKPLEYKQELDTKALLQDDPSKNDPSKDPSKVEMAGSQSHNFVSNNVGLASKLSQKGERGIASQASKKVVGPSSTHGSSQVFNNEGIAGSTSNISDEHLEATYSEEIARMKQIQHQESTGLGLNNYTGPDDQISTQDQVSVQQNASPQIKKMDAQKVEGDLEVFNIFYPNRTQTKQSMAAQQLVPPISISQEGQGQSLQSSSIVDNNINSHQENAPGGQPAGSAGFLHPPSDASKAAENQDHGGDDHQAIQLQMPVSLPNTSVSPQQQRPGDHQGENPSRQTIGLHASGDGHPSNLGGGARQPDPAGPQQSQIMQHHQQSQHQDVSLRRDQSPNDPSKAKMAGSQSLRGIASKASKKVFGTSLKSFFQVSSTEKKFTQPNMAPAQVKKAEEQNQEKEITQQTQFSIGGFKSFSINTGNDTSNKGSASKSSQNQEMQDLQDFPKNDALKTPLINKLMEEAAENHLESRGRSDKEEGEEEEGEDEREDMNEDEKKDREDEDDESRPNKESPTTKAPGLDVPVNDNKLSDLRQPISDGMGAGSMHSQMNLSPVMPAQLSGSQHFSVHGRSHLEHQDPRGASQHHRNQPLISLTGVQPLVPSRGSPSEPQQPTRVQNYQQMLNQELADIVANKAPQVNYWIGLRPGGYVSPDNLGDFDAGQLKIYGEDMSILDKLQPDWMTVELPTKEEKEVGVNTFYYSWVASVGTYWQPSINPGFGLREWKISTEKKVEFVTKLRQQEQRWRLRRQALLKTLQQQKLVSSTSLTGVNQSMISSLTTANQRPGQNIEDESSNQNEGGSLNQSISVATSQNQVNQHAQTQGGVTQLSQGTKSYILQSLLARLANQPQDSMLNQPYEENKCQDPPGHANQAELEITNTLANSQIHPRQAEPTQRGNQLPFDQRSSDSESRGRDNQSYLPSQSCSVSPQSTQMYQSISTTQVGVDATQGETFNANTNGAMEELEDLIENIQYD